MLIADKEGNVVFKLEDGVSYNFSKSDEYINFLMWITNPNPEVEIDPDKFEVAVTDDADTTAKLKRYSDFLKDFAEKRTQLLAECTSLTGKEREKKIEELLANLQASR